MVLCVYVWFCRCFCCVLLCAQAGDYVGQIQRCLVGTAAVQVLL